MAKQSDKLLFYTVDETYVDYLASREAHIFHNAKASQTHSRKYIGIVLRVNRFNYFAPLSSFKEKHRHMKSSLDFIKVKDYAVINLNNMFPVPTGSCYKVDFKAEPDARYRALLQAEYRAIKPLQEKIRKNAANLYKHKIQNGESTKLARRCNDFVKLERLCRAWQSSRQ